MNEIEIYELEDALASLPAYQSSTIEKLIEKNGVEKAAEIWLESMGPKETKHFGGEIVPVDNKSSLSLAKKCKFQLDMLLCGHPDYQEEYQKFIGQGKAITIASATLIAEWLAPIVGISIVLLNPFVLLILHTIIKMGLKTYCMTKNFN